VIDIIDRFDKQDFDVNVMKMAIGRLLQAGWNSPASIRKHGIETAIKYVDPIREQLTSDVEHYPKKIPAIVVEFIIMGISEYSFGSKTKRLSNQYPTEWRRLLPAPRKGFRKKKR